MFSEGNLRLKNKVRYAKKKKMPAIKWHISHHFQNIVSVVTHSAYSNGRKKGRTKHKHKNIHKRTRRTHMYSEIHTHL